MLFMPFQVLSGLLRGLLTLLLLGGGAYLLKEWYIHRRAVEVRVSDEHTPRRNGIDDDRQPVRAPAPEIIVLPSWGLDEQTIRLVSGVALIGWSLSGAWIQPFFFRRRSEKDRPEVLQGEVQRLSRPDGTELWVELYGSPTAPPLVLTHGWGLDSNEWCYAKKQLAEQYRLIVWDLPGLGRSSSPSTNDWSLEKLAADLHAVLSLAGGRPAVLLGHSIGGMITLTFCRLFPETMGRSVCGLVLAQTTYTNPVRTASLAWLYLPLQKPLLEPLCHLMVWLAPGVWLMNWASYLNGSAHQSTEQGSFSGQETWEQLSFLSRYYVRSWPGVIGRGLLAMFRYDATATLLTIPVPTLVVVGEKDSICPPAAGEFIARSVPGAELHTLRTAKHCGLFEFNKEFNDAVKTFVASCHIAREQSAGVKEAYPSVPV